MKLLWEVLIARFAPTLVAGLLQFTRALNFIEVLMFCCLTFLC